MKKFIFIPIVFLITSVYSQLPEVPDTTTYTIKAKLLKAEGHPPHCGVIAWALAQKFEIIESDFDIPKPKFQCLLIQTCPEFLGENYFVKNKIYNLKVTKKSMTPFSYTVINPYEKDNLLIFWIR